MGAWPSSGQQFPLWVGLAADEVFRLELFHRAGEPTEVPLGDNAFAFQTRKGQPAKLVAYDSDGRVVRVEMVGGHGGGLTGIAVAP